MLLIPAIDIKDGQCVRLRQGRFEDATVYGDDPVAMAAHWCAAGARRLHLVDLDGAVAGRPASAGIVRRIAAAHPDVAVQVGGGVRDIDTVSAYVGAGVSQVIIGTAAVRDPDFVSRACESHPGVVVVGLDARDGKVAVSGWLEDSALDVVELARRFAGDGIHSIVYTDIGRDGMLSGVNVEATAALAEAVDVPVVASGGVKSLDDIRALAERAHTGISGAITGRAIYEGTLDFAEGAALAARLVPEARTA